MNFDVVFQNMPFLMKGFVITLKIAFISSILSLLLGVVLGVVRFLRLFLISRVVGIFVDITRSIPLILYIIFVYFSFAPTLYANSSFLIFLGIDSLEMYSAIIALVAFNSAYIAEIIRSGLESVEKEQIFAAKALGLNSFQVIKYVVLPQAFSSVKPALSAQFVTLLKDTSLASAIGLIELTRAGEIVYENSFHEFQILSFVALVYIVTNFIVQSLFRIEDVNL
jgi:His/Glu/Gln/Arg/opine family amino acid ABC transporter permease subunit